MGVSTLSTLTIRSATADEFDPVLELLAESVDWLRSQGLDQWSTWESWRTKMRPALERGDVWLLCDGEALIGTITVETGGDSDFWTADELGEPAAYVSKLSVRRSHAGNELGQLLLEWAGDHAYRYGCAWLRLDAWKTNERLHSYYKDRGWTYLRTAEVAGRHSGALFQVVASPLSGAMRRRLREVPEIPTIDAPLIAPQDSSDPAGNWRPDHTHQSMQFTIEYPWLSPRPLLVVPGYRYRLRFDQSYWSLERNQTASSWSQEGRMVQTSWRLDTAARYVLTHDGTKPCSVRMTEVRPGRSLAISHILFR